MCDTPTKKPLSLIIQDLTERKTTKGAHFKNPPTLQRSCSTPVESTLSKLFAYKLSKTFEDRRDALVCNQTFSNNTISEPANTWLAFEDGLNQVELASDQYGEPTIPQNLDTSSPKPLRRKQMERTIVSNSGIAADYSNNNIITNNNNVKNERLSPGTPDTSSRSPTVTPSSASHPGTPPSNEQQAFAGCRNYSDFMRTLAAKYQANDYFSAARNGLPPPPHPRLKPSPFPMMPNIPQMPPRKENDLNRPKPDYVTLLNPLMNNTLYPPIMDMTATQALVTLLKNAADDESQNLLKHSRTNVSTKRPDPVSPLDLSPGAPIVKRMRKNHQSSSCSSGGLVIPSRAQSESPRLGDDLKNWSVDEVASFVGSIDICAEYAPLFKEQCIDGAALPHLTEDHLITKMKMKIGPAVKLRSIVAQKSGSCHSCLHCVQCHKSPSSPELTTTKGSFSDSGGSTS